MTLAILLSYYLILRISWLAFIVILSVKQLIGTFASFLIPIITAVSLLDFFLLIFLAAVLFLKIGNSMRRKEKVTVSIYLSVIMFFILLWINITTDIWITRWIHF